MRNNNKIYKNMHMHLNMVAQKTGNELEALHI